MVLKNLFSKKSPTQKSNESPETATVANEPPEPQQATEPPTAVHLETAIIENARNDNQETRSKVFQELLFSDLLLVLADPTSEGATPEAPLEETTDKQPSVNVAIMSNPQGVQFSAAFTSAAAARRWRTEGGQYVAIRGQDIFKLLEPSPAEVIVINPGSAPFVVLSKVEYRQLAMGIVPQSPASPVQLNSAVEEQEKEQQGGMQIAFPPDAFTEDQRLQVEKILKLNKFVEAVALGAILPPDAVKDAPWMRTIFLRVIGVENKQETMQKFCMNVRDSVAENNNLFSELNFEVGVMPDPNFWIAMHQNKFVLLDKNPPKIPTSDESHAITK